MAQAISSVLPNREAMLMALARLIRGVHHNPLTALACAVAALIPLMLTPTGLLIYQPGVTVDLLGNDPANESAPPIVQVDGHETFHSSGQLRFTTVSVLGNPRSRLSAALAFSGLWSSQQRLLPMEVQYPPTVDAQQVTVHNQQLMSRSQEFAISAALRTLKIAPNEVEVVQVVPRRPADGVLKEKDRIVAVAGHEVTSAEQVIQRVQESQRGQPLTMDIMRQPSQPNGAPTGDADVESNDSTTVGQQGSEREGDRQRLQVQISPTPVDPNAPSSPLQVGISLRELFPVEVTIHMEDDIGGPSAGAMMALSIYDALTPGQLTGGKIIAGTGTVDEHGTVGEISGVEQKVLAAHRDGATVFLTPENNCSAARAWLPQGMQLVKISTVEQAVEALNALNTGQGHAPTC